MGLEDLTTIRAAAGLPAAAQSYWWVMPLVVAVSVAAASFWAWRSIRENRAIARRRATLDLIERSESSDYYRRAAAAFSAVRRDPQGFEPLFAPTNPELQAQRRRVLDFLNHYELVAIGIRDGVLDEAFYRRWMRSVVIRDWAAAEAFVQHIRAPTPDSGLDADTSAAFAQFEAMAEAWRDGRRFDGRQRVSISGRRARTPAATRRRTAG
ncbi:MAG: DUF4760 domain-containing protein [Paracoccaceae bacterium]